MKITKRQLRRIIKEVFQSHTREPLPGDKIVNVNSSCKHFQSRGEVDAIDELPDDQGKLVVYTTTNSGNNWNIGDILEKTMDQLEFET